MIIQHYKLCIFIFMFSISAIPKEMLTLDEILPNMQNRMSSKNQSSKAIVYWRRNLSNRIHEMIDYNKKSLWQEFQEKHPDIIDDIFKNSDNIDALRKADIFHCNLYLSQIIKSYIYLSQYTFSNQQEFKRYVKILSFARMAIRYIHYKEDQYKILYENKQTYNDQDKALEGLFIYLFYPDFDKESYEKLVNSDQITHIPALLSQGSVLHEIISYNMLEFMQLAAIRDLEISEEYVDNIFRYIPQKLSEILTIGAIYDANIEPDVGKLWFFRCHVRILQDKTVEILNDSDRFNTIQMRFIIHFIIKYYKLSNGAIFDEFKEYLGIFYCLAYSYLIYNELIPEQALLKQACYGDKPIPGDIKDIIVEIKEIGENRLPDIMRLEQINIMLNHQMDKRESPDNAEQLERIILAKKDIIAKLLPFSDKETVKDALAENQIQTDKETVKDALAENQIQTKQKWRYIIALLFIIIILGILVCYFLFNINILSYIYQTVCSVII